MKKEFYTWENFTEDIKLLTQRVKLSPDFQNGFDGIWGPPRGGLPLAVCLSHSLDLPLLFKPTAKTLVVDDIADTGKTLASFERNFIATIFYHRQSKIVPNIWLREKTADWIIFPWENPKP